MERAAYRRSLGFGAALCALMAVPCAHAATSDGLLNAAASEPAAVPAARAQRLNPTGRTIALTVPAKDGAAYLGDVPLTIGADDSLTFPADRAIQLLSQVLAPDILDSLQASLAGKLLVGPADLNAGGIEVAYDPRTLELRFVIAPQLRASRSLSVTPLDREQLGTYIKPQDFSAYLNLRGSVDLVEDGFDTGFGAPILLLDGAVRLGSVVAESDAIWTPGSDGVDFQRIGSRLVMDDMENLVRYSAGDLRTQSRGFQSTPDIAGVSLFRSYSVLNPQQIVRPRGDRSFRLERPSTVEVIVNGQQVRRLTLAPGNYNLRDFPFAQGANDIRLNVLDDTGRTEVLSFNVFLDQTQLAKGLTEFGVYGGVKAPLGLRGPEYSDDPTFSGFVRHGLSDFVTVGANVQLDKNVQMAGVEAVLGTALGTFGTHVAYSHSRDVGDGFAVQATFQRLIQRRDGQADSLNLFFEHRSEHFAPVSFFLQNNPYEFELGGGYSHAISPDLYAGFDARYSKGRGLVPDVENYRLSAGLRLTPRASLTAETRYENDSRGKEWSGFVTLTVRLGMFSSARTEYDTRENRVRASYQTVQGTGVGSYNLTADVERSDLGAGTSINANYLANRAELGFSHFGIYNNDFSNSLSQRSTFRLGTSLALAGGSLSLGRPIYDSFAIVRPHPSIADVDVVIDPSSVGYTASTGKVGTATVAGLSAYAERTIPITVEGAAAADIDVGQGTYKVFPAYRSGYLLEVGSSYNVTALGTMLDQEGNPVSLVSGKATELDRPDSKSVTLFTNRQGRFGATGLGPGRWRIEMLDANKSTFIIEIPRDAKGVVRVGTITPLKDQ